jgi:small subunit ribosomal protein S1
MEPFRELPEKPKLNDLDAGIESELQAALGGLTEQEIFADPGSKGPRPAAGEPQPQKKARVVAVRGQDVYLEMPGARSQGVIPVQQFPDAKPPDVGAEIDVNIEGFDRDNGLLIFSLRGATVHVDWSSVAAGMTVEARVMATNKGGLSVEVNGIRGFMPISQIDLYRVENADQFINQKLRCLVTEVLPHEKNLVVSRRALMEKEREQEREKTWATLAEGQIYDGIVRSVKDFGAFVDLGGVDGLLHVSEMSWQRVNDATKIVQPGQAVKVMVLKIDHERRKVSLGLKQLTASPWDDLEDRFPTGCTAKGKVTRLMDFGAFVELEPGVEGLVHISELAPQRVHRVTDIVKEGQEVTLKVLSVDKTQRRISLSIKAAAPKPEAEPEPEAPAEAAAEPKPQRPRNVPLRGGVGHAFVLPPLAPPAPGTGESS